MKQLALIAACLLTTTGCTLMPEALQPHQLWKLNRQPASGRDDAFFSVEEKARPTSESYVGDAAKTVEAVDSKDPFLGLDD